MEKHSGYYFGTELYGICFLPHKKDNLATRGWGEYWFGFDGLYFKAQDGGRIFAILYASIEKVKTGLFHACWYGKGNIIIKIKWKNIEGLRLCSGFLLKQNQKEVEHLITHYRRVNLKVTQPC